MEDSSDQRGLALAASPDWAPRWRRQRLLELGEARDQILRRLLRRCRSWPSSALVSRASLACASPRRAERPTAPRRPWRAGRWCRRARAEHALGIGEAPGQVAAARGPLRIGACGVRKIEQGRASTTISAPSAPAPRCDRRAATAGETCEASAGRLGAQPQRARSATLGRRPRPEAWLGRLDRPAALSALRRAPWRPGSTSVAFRSMVA